MEKIDCEACAEDMEDMEDRDERNRQDQELSILLIDISARLSSITNRLAALERVMSAQTADGSKSGLGENPRSGLEPDSLLNCALDRLESFHRSSKHVVTRFYIDSGLDIYVISDAEIKTRIGTVLDTEFADLPRSLSTGDAKIVRR